MGVLHPLLFCHLWFLRWEQGQVGDFIWLWAQEVPRITLFSTIYAIHISRKLCARHIVNRDLIKVRCLTWRLSVVLPVLVKDLLEAVSVNGTNLATLITVRLNVLNRVVEILSITGLNGSDHVLFLVEDSCGDG